VIAFTGPIVLAVFAGTSAWADFVITEIMAAAEFSIPDDDGEPSDWIEITH
jgi:hypothetical protein